MLAESDCGWLPPAAFCPSRCPSPGPFASAGRLRGHIAGNRDLFDMFEFQRAATRLLGAEVTLYFEGAAAHYSEGALRNEHVSPDLAAATPL